MSILLIQSHADIGAEATSIALDPSLASFPCKFDHDLRTPLGTLTQRCARRAGDARGGA